MVADSSVNPVSTASSAFFRLGHNIPKRCFCASSKREPITEPIMSVFLHLAVEKPIPVSQLIVHLWNR